MSDTGAGASGATSGTGSTGSAMLLLYVKNGEKKGRRIKSRYKVKEIAYFSWFMSCVGSEHSEYLAQLVMVQLLVSVLPDYFCMGKTVGT
jgi:hypothetical protein